MKSIESMTKKELDELPQYPYTPAAIETEEIFVMKSRKKHESGFSCFVSFITVDEKPCKLCDCSDVLDIQGCRVDSLNGVCWRFFAPAGMLKIYRYGVTFTGDPQTIMRKLADIGGQNIKYVEIK